MNINDNSNPFGNLNTDNLEQQGDYLGGGGVLDSDVYTGKIKLAYAGASPKSGARFLAVHIDINGREYKETLYVTNKNGENFYTKADKKIPLPGFTTANDLALLTTGHPLSAQQTEEKVASLYDFNEKKELPTKVRAVVSMMGKDVSVGILRKVVDKNKLNEATGKYEPTGETREENTIDKVFHAETGKTVSEFTTGATEAKFKDQWAEKNRGQVRNQAKGATAGGSTGAPGRAAGAPPAAGGGAPAGKSLFGG